jgi:hypothetical protein
MEMGRFLGLKKSNRKVLKNKNNTKATERFLSDNNNALKIFPVLNFLDPITYHY